MSDNKLSGKSALQIVKSRTAVIKAGRYDLQVTSTPTHYEDKVIINLKGATSKMIEASKQSLRDGNYDEAANNQLSFSPFADNAFIPAKGETVNCQLGMVDARDGGQVLAIISMSPMVAENASKVSLGDEFANLLDEVDAEEATAKNELG